MADWHDIAEEMTLKGKTAREIADELNVNISAVRSHIKRFRKRNGINRDCSGNLVSESTLKPYQLNKTTMNSDGSFTYEMRIKIPKGESITVEKVLDINNLSIDEWDVVTFTFNNWQGFTNNDGEIDKVDLYQVKLQVKPKVKNDITFEDIDKYFADKKYLQIETPKPKQYQVDSEILEIDITDLHSGLLSYRKETGEDFDVKIACERLVNTCEELVARCKGKSFEKIVIASLGDIIHIDNNQGTTTKGTPQDVDGRVERIVEHTFNAFIKCINMLLEIAPIDFIYVKGNHDELVGCLFAFALKQVYKDNPYISFDISPNPQKAVMIYDCLVGFEHNSGNKNIASDWLVNDYRNLFGKCKYAELHAGHLHSQITNERANGVVVRNLPALCGTSSWERISHYRAYRALVCFVWSKKNLLKEQWYLFI